MWYATLGMHARMHAPRDDVARGNPLRSLRLYEAPLPLEVRVYVPR